MNEIYQKSWFGKGIETNTISWGSVLFPSNRQYIQRVLQDGGTIESSKCLIGK